MVENTYSQKRVPPLARVKTKHMESSKMQTLNTPSKQRKTSWPKKKKENNEKQDTAK